MVVRSRDALGAPSLIAAMSLRLATVAMGTRFELVLDAEDEPRARAAGEAALELVRQHDARFSLFRADSLIARINRDAATRAVQLDAETFELLAACLELRAATAGAFDVAVGALMRSWGFRSRVDELDVVRERGSFELDERTRSVRFTSANTALDLGAIAKGHTLDQAATLLRENGIERALMHGGTSSVIALGAPQGETAWRVQLGADSTLTACLRDKSLSFSSPRGRTADFAGHEVGHILDPRTGVPTELDKRCAVVGSSARDCDAWSTAALVLASRGDDIESLRPRALSISLSSHHGDARVLGDDSVFELRLQRATPPR